MSNLLIEGNIIDQGSATANGSTSTVYTYDGMMRIIPNAKINKNSMYVPTTGISSNMMLLDGGACKVTENTFVRGASTIASYIYNNSSVKQIITNNSFDSPNVDGGTNINVFIENSVGVSIVEQNINQTGYAVISLPSLSGPARQLLGGDPIASTIGIFAKGLGGVGLQAPNNNTSTSDFQFSGSLNEYLPKNVKLLSAAVGVYSDNANQSYASTTTQLSFQVVNTTFVIPQQYIPSTFTSTILDIHYILVNSSSPTIVPSNIMNIANTGSLPVINIATLNAATQYLFADLSSHNIIPTNNFQSIMFNFLGTFAIDSSGSTGQASLNLSALVIQYRW